MIQKYFFIAIVFFSVSLQSCRQDDEATSKEENKSLSKPNIWEDEGQTASRDSILPEDDETIDPPKNGTHWKSSDSLETIDPPKNGTHWKSSDSLEVISEPEDPPKNGTHWKTMP